MWGEYWLGEKPELEIVKFSLRHTVSRWLDLNEFWVSMSLNN